MKGSRETLSKLLTKRYERIISNKKEVRRSIDYMTDIGFPVIEVTDVIQLRKQAQDCSDRMLYYLLKSADSNLIGDYFTQKEIKEYETTKYKPVRFSLPIKWNMVEVVEGTQWIGKITVKELMKLRDAQLINYNERTQRTLKRVENKDFEYYQIYLNRNAVEEIEKSFSEDQYIPNTITLNLPEESEFNYSEGILTIKEMEHFDIIDGYHRYIAMSNIYNRNSSFDYPMELRVVCFNEETAKQFIWQEDQKTKMRKMDSDSFNQNSPANQVINLINQHGMFRNVIGRNNSPIDQGLVSQLINKIWFNTTKKISRKDIIQVKDYIIQHLMMLLQNDPNIFERKWSYEFTVTTFVLMSSDDICEATFLDDINKTLNTIKEEEDAQAILGRKGYDINKRTITRLLSYFKNNIAKEV